jgi:hypothetical protein
MACSSREVLAPFETHERIDAAARRPPKDALLDESAAEGLEMRARQALPLGRVHARKAFLQVDARHPAPLGDEPKKHSPDCVAHVGQHAERQEMHQPHEGEDDPAHAAGRGFAPRGVL